MSTQLSLPTFSTPVKHGSQLAESIRSIVQLDNHIVRRLLNREADLTAHLFNVIMNKSVFSWTDRNPKPAVDLYGKFIGASDLDVLTWLMGMARRRAVIKIPHYENFRPTVHNPLEVHVTEERFGQITGLVSSQDGHSFSIRMRDVSVKATHPSSGHETMGAFRSYMVVDPNGDLYDGWKAIEWWPNKQEQEVLRYRKQLVDGNTLYFNTAVHPNRWISMFGAGYLLLKVCLVRLKDEKKFYADEVKRLLGSGIEFPKRSRMGVSAYDIDEYATERYSDVGMPAVFSHLEAKLQMPELTGSFRPVAETTEGLIEATRRVRELRRMQTEASVVVRADELAYKQYGKGRIPAWMGTGAEWQAGYVEPGKRTKWNRLSLPVDAKVCLMYRLRNVTQTVAA